MSQRPMVPLRPAVGKAPASCSRCRLQNGGAGRVQVYAEEGMTLSVEDVNQALASHNLEPLYGLAESNLERMSFHDHSNHKEVEDGAEEEKSRFLGLGMVSLTEMAKAPLPSYPWHLS